MILRENKPLRKLLISTLIGRDDIHAISVGEDNVITIYTSKSALSHDECYNSLKHIDEFSEDALKNWNPPLQIQVRLNDEPGMMS